MIDLIQSKMLLFPCYKKTHPLSLEHPGLLDSLLDILGRANIDFSQVRHGGRGIALDLARTIRTGQGSGVNLAANNDRPQIRLDNRNGVVLQENKAARVESFAGGPLGRCGVAAGTAAPQ
jgi:hypothetical protein